jgi:hypothetical protein
MSDDKTRSGPRDASKINLSEDCEVRPLTEKFGVSRAQLERAGSGAAAVEAHLQRGAH